LALDTLRNEIVNDAHRYLVRVSNVGVNERYYEECGETNESRGDRTEESSLERNFS
jgi:hypothetical protein